MRSEFEAVVPLMDLLWKPPVVVWACHERARRYAGVGHLGAAPGDGQRNAECILHVFKFSWINFPGFAPDIHARKNVKIIHSWVNARHSCRKIDARKKTPENHLHATLSEN